MHPRSKGLKHSPETSPHVGCSMRLCRPSREQYRVRLHDAGRMLLRCDLRLQAPSVHECRALGHRPPFFILRRRSRAARRCRRREGGRGRGRCRRAFVPDPATHRAATPLPPAGRPGRAGEGERRAMSPPWNLVQCVVNAQAAAARTTPRARPSPRPRRRPQSPTTLRAPFGTCLPACR